MTTAQKPSRRRFLTQTGAGAAAIALSPLLSRYTPGAPLWQETSNGLVHLNYNENAYGPSRKALDVIRDNAVSMACRYYPDDSYEELSNVLAKHHELKRENIQVAVGSTEILKIADDVFLGQKPRLVVAEPAYEAVIQYAVNSKAEAAKVPLTADYRHDLVKMAAAVTPETGMVYICNPNNPTGTIVRKDELQKFMDRVPQSVTVVIDEAYFHFVSDPAFESAVRYAQEGRNIIVARTFSKIYGLAGMRIGYAVGRKDLIAKIKPFTVDYSISGIAAKVALAAIADSAHVERLAKLNNAQRQVFYDEMKKMKFEPIPSESNFVMVNVRKPVAPLIEELKKRKVLVGREFPAMPNFLRVTVGTAEEMRKFYVAFREVVSA